MPDTDSSSLAARAGLVVETATQYLESRFLGDFADGISTGLMGSCARSELSPVSDIDYCVIFDTKAVSLREQNLAEIVKRLVNHVGLAQPNEPFAQRFSVCWTSLDDLRSGLCATGRWPLYDRGAFREGGVHVAGVCVPKDCIPVVSIEQLRAESIAFMLNEMRPKLEAMRFFQNLSHLSTERAQELGGVLLTKCALMPVRMLYVLQPTSSMRPFVSAEEAVRACAEGNAHLPWWLLVEKATAWRLSGMTSVEQYGEAARLFAAFGRELYGHLLAEYVGVAVALGLHTSAEALRGWINEVGAG